VAVGSRRPGVQVILWNQSHGAGRAEHLVHTLDVGQVAADVNMSTERMHGFGLR
jgi:hypothetical protein